MRRDKKSPYNRLRKNKKAASPAISMVIITAITVVLVLVTGNYAYQVLERQQGASEFETVKKSILVFDDAVRDVAWDLGGSRSARFTVNYGGLEIIPNNAEKGLLLSVSVAEYPDANYSCYTGYIRYSISTNYANLGNVLESYILGDNRTVVSSGTESLSQAFIKQESGRVIITLGYRVRVIRTSVVKVGNNTVNYVDISIIKITATKWSTYTGNFDLVARNVGINASLLYGPYDVNDDGLCKIKVHLGESSEEILIKLDRGNVSYPGQVVFNFVIAEVQVSA